MVKFTKDGSTANTAAVKLARAFTGRDKVAICADHPFYSYDDWAMVVTPLDAGIPAGVRELTLTFPYGDLAAVEELFDAHPGEIACVMLEPERTVAPPEGYLAGLAELCRARGALLVFDENVTGFRWANGGAQAVHGVTPDLSSWGKAMANGFALSALAGRREVMELGGLDHDRERVFLLSTTHGAEHTGLAAGLATMRVYESEPVVETLVERGGQLRALLGEVARSHGLEQHFRVARPRPVPLLRDPRRDGAPSQAFRTRVPPGDDQARAARAVVRRQLRAHPRGRRADGGDRRRGAGRVSDGARRRGRTVLEGRPVQSVYRRYNAPDVAEAAIVRRDARWRAGAGTSCVRRCYASEIVRRGFACR